MKKQITLQIKTKEYSPGLFVTLVKNGKKIEAKIYAPNSTRSEYQIEKAGMAFYRPSLESALEMVRNDYEERINAFSIETVYTVIIEG